MTRWARLTWQAADPAARAADLGRRLGVTFAAPPALSDTSPASTGTWVLPLGTADLEVVPWRRESPTDHPLASGRLVFEPIEDGGPDPQPSAAPPLGLVGVAWCTVELERAQAELEPWLVPAPAAGPAGDEGGGDGDPVDPHLGSRTRVRGAPGLPGGVLVLSEPVTEGRLAASLARDDEGPCALYLRPAGGLDAWVAAARARRVTLSAIQAGPFGRSVLLSGSPAAGPHVLLVDAPLPSSARVPPGTIAP